MDMFRVFLSCLTRIQASILLTKRYGNVEIYTICFWWLDISRQQRKSYKVMVHICARFPFQTKRLQQCTKVRYYHIYYRLAQSQELLQTG
ncbi:MAG: hypothetical protein ACLS3P_04465 [Agathobacter sp.]|uniref:hypothetical protein n=1 Tax=Agathobacter sp. TaxID=2021311 RepID=UPI003993E3D6